MIQVLLCWRYLRTRWIALASIVSVTLGVATLIVVNSVMDGFTEEMQNRIHGILSDVVVESHSAAGISDPRLFEEQIHRVLGDDIEGITPVVTVPAMLTSNYRGTSHTQQINLIGIDRESYASVSDFSRYLLHPANRDGIEFDLRETGYAPDRMSLQPAGWEYRRHQSRLKKEWDRGLAEMQAQNERERAQKQALQEKLQSIGEPTATAALPEFAAAAPAADDSIVNRKDASEFNPAAGPSMGGAAPAALKIFDPEFETREGIVLGIGIGSIRYRDDAGEVVDHFLIRPGDDVTIALPGAGTPPRAITEQFTVVDVYESQMSEYDSTFAFVPIDKLQQIRGMIDPQSGRTAVSSLQIKLRPGVDSAAARDKLRAMFPPETTLVHVNTWRDSQGPLLAAVQMETTILNILLFMIIAVAGFGILATFYMIVVEKTRDIGVLKSLGTGSGGVAGIFLAYGLLLGAAGSGVGAVIGLLFVRHINDIAALLEVVTGREVFDPTVYYFTRIPTVVHPEMVAWVVCGAVAIAVLASVLPSYRAARMHPVEALRYE